ALRCRRRRSRPRSTGGSPAARPSPPRPTTTRTLALEGLRAGPASARESYRSETSLAVSRAIRLAAGIDGSGDEVVDGLDQLAQVIGLLEKGVGADLARALPDVWCGADDNDDGVRPSSPDALDDLQRVEIGQEQVEVMIAVNSGRAARIATGAVTGSLRLLV